MTARTFRNVALAVAAVAIVLQAPLFAHHSFAMYDQNKTVTVTGVVKQYVPQANHAEFHLYLLTDDRKGLEKKDGKYVEYGVEMAGTAQLERQGVTAQTYPVGTVLSVKVNPQRDGTTRLYTRRDVARLKLILMGRRVGFSLREVKQMIDLYDPSGSNSKQLKLALEKSEKQLGKLEKQRVALDEAISELTGAMEVVRSLLAQRQFPKVASS